jgi:hypothetical protein
MPYKFTEGRRHKFSKARYRVTNWPEYDLPFTPPPEVIDEGRRQLRLPIANRLIAEFDAQIREISEIVQAQLVAKPTKDHECDDVGWIFSAIENSTAAFIELLTTGATPEASVTPRRPLTSFRHVRSVTLYSPHCTVLHPGRIIARLAFTRPAKPGAKGDRTLKPGHHRGVWVDRRQGAGGRCHAHTASRHRPGDRHGGRSHRSPC